MDHILDHLTDPVEREHREHQKTDNLSLGASSTPDIASGVIARRVLDIDRNRENGEPCAERQRQKSTEAGDDPDMSEPPSDVNGLPKHQNGEWEHAAPCPETVGVEQAEDQEDYPRGVVPSVEVVDGGTDTEADAAIH